MSVRNYYEVLGISPQASLKEVEIAWKMLTTHWNPERNHSPEAGIKYMEAMEAHSVLSDPVSRYAHDLELANEHGRQHPDAPQEPGNFPSLKDYVKRFGQKWHQKKRVMIPLLLAGFYVMMFLYIATMSLFMSNLVDRQENGRAPDAQEEKESVVALPEHRDYSFLNDVNVEQIVGGTPRAPFVVVHGEMDEETWFWEAWDINNKFGITPNGTNTDTFSTIVLLFSTEQMSADYSHATYGTDVYYVDRRTKQIIRKSSLSYHYTAPQLLSVISENVEGARLKDVSEYPILEEEAVPDEQQESSGPDA